MGDRDGVQSGVCVWRGTVELLCVMIGGAAFRKGYVIAVPIKMCCRGCDG